MVSMSFQDVFSVSTGNFLSFFHQLLVCTFFGTSHRASILQISTCTFTCNMFNCVYLFTTDKTCAGIGFNVVSCLVFFRFIAFAYKFISGASL